MRQEQPLAALICDEQDYSLTKLGQILKKVKQSDLVAFTTVVHSGLKFRRLRDPHDRFATDFARLILMIAQGVFVMGQPFFIGWLIHTAAFRSVGQRISKVGIYIFKRQSDVAYTVMVSHKEHGLAAQVLQQ